MRTGELDPQSGLTLVTLPRPPETFDAKQNSLTQELLDSVGEGVEVGVSGPVVYSYRRGGTKAFWSRYKFDCGNEPQEVAKMEPQGLVLLQDFVRGECPSVRRKPDGFSQLARRPTELACRFLIVFCVCKCVCWYV